MNLEQPSNKKPLDDKPKSSGNRTNKIKNEPSTQTILNNLAMQQNPEAKKSNYSFESNRKYFTISIYTLVVITLSSFIIYCILNADKTSASIDHFTSAITPFIIAFFIAYILNPIVVTIKKLLTNVFKMKNQKATNTISLAATYIIFISIIAITLIYIIPELGASVSDLSDVLTPAIKSITEQFDNLQLEYPDLEFLGALEDKLTQTIASMLTYVTNFVANLLPTLINISISVVKLVINIFLSLVISIYMLSDKKMISTNLKRALYAFFSETKVTNFIHTFRECSNIFSNFIIGKTIDSIIIGILCFIIMTLLKLPYSVLLSIIVGITNMIPYFGPFIGAVPGVLLYLVLDPIKALIFTIMIFALQQFDGLYLGPKILGSSTGLKPLWVIFAITLGGAYAGVLGMFLGVPIVGVIAFLLNKTITTRLHSKNISSDKIESP